MDHSQHSMDATSHAGHSMAAMNLAAPGIAASAHDKHVGHSVAMFRDKFWLSLALTIPVVIWSRDPQKWLGYAAPAFPGSDLTQRFWVRFYSYTAAWSSCAVPVASSQPASPR
jgi:Cu2+-exporting ATPase